MPLADQIALRLLDAMLQGGNAPNDAGEAVAQAYAYADEFLSTARARYRAEQAAKLEAERVNDAADAASPPAKDGVG